MKIIGDGGHAAVINDLLKAVGSFYDEESIVIAVGDNRDRKREAEANGKANYPKLIHPRAWVSPRAHVFEGAVIMAGAIVQAEAFIGRFCIVNTGATVDHHCTVYDFAHIAPGAHLCGNVEVGEGALVGVGVGIAPGAKIPAWSIVKARRLEIESVPDNG